MRKSILKIVSILFIITVLTFSFVACNNSDGNSGNSATTVKLTQYNYSDYLIMNYTQTNLGPSTYNSMIYCYRIDGSVRGKNRNYVFNNVKVGIAAGQYATMPKLYCELTDYGYGEFSYNDTYGLSYPNVQLYVVSISGTVTIE